MSYSIVTAALASAVAPAGTFAASYPSGKNPGSFFLAMAHKLIVGQDTYFFPVDFDLSFGASTITVTNKSSTITWPAGATIRLQLEEPGQRSLMDYPLDFPNSPTDTVGGSTQSIDVRAKLFASTNDANLVLINLGAPIALDDDGICAAQSMAAAGTMTINGALAVSGAVTLDVPRALQIVSSGADTAVITVTGTDVYGRALTEAITLNGTTAVNGKKAFKTISLVTNSAAIANLAKVGTTDILGLPVFVPAEGYVVAELQNGNAFTGGMVQVPFQINQTDLLAGTAQNFVSPVDGFVTRAVGIVQSAIATGGEITFQVGTTDITGLVLSVANSAPVGTVATDTPTTPFSATTVVANGQRIQVTPGSTFATSGAYNGYVEITGTNGILVPGIRTAGGSTTTTGDVRGTYKPSVACDGATVYELLIAVGQRYPGIRQNVSGA